MDSSMNTTLEFIDFQSRRDNKNDKYKYTMILRLIIITLLFKVYKMI